MAKTVKVDGLAAAIASAVREYTEDVSEAIAEKVDQTADLVLADTKAGGQYQDRTGNYRKGWKKTKADSTGVTRRIVWNKDEYRRVHLLEFGHATRDGTGRVRAFPHLVPAYEKHGAALPDHIRRIIRNGGGS